jgi:cytoskeletal protein CcmA (bactofilin family)
MKPDAARHSIGGNFTAGTAIVTGAVEGMIVDGQCIMQGRHVAQCYHTKLITIDRRAQICPIFIPFDDSEWHRRPARKS